MTEYRSRIRPYPHPHCYNLTYTLIFSFDIHVFRHFYIRHFYFRPKLGLPVNLARKNRILTFIVFACLSISTKHTLSSLIFHGGLFYYFTLCVFFLPYILISLYLKYDFAYLLNVSIETVR